jgi:hypothetical protein
VSNRRPWFPRGDRPQWVNRVALTVRRTLPIFPDQPTSAGSFGMSQKCHKQTASAGAAACGASLVVELFFVEALGAGESSANQLVRSGTFLDCEVFGAKMAISSVVNPNMVRSEGDFEMIIIAQGQKQNVAWAVFAQVRKICELPFPLWVVCHERSRSKRRRTTVREMKEGPSGSAIRC